MIGIEGQYIFKFSIDTKTDFIVPEDLILFEITEECGLNLPTFKLAFRTTEPNILRYLNEGNDFKVSFGKSKDSLYEIILNIFTVYQNKNGDDANRIDVIGMMSKLPFLMTPKKQISDKKSGIEVLKEIGSRYFKVDSNIEKSEDSMYWIQPNVSDKLYMMDLWFHSYLSKSFIACAIGIDGTLRIRDIVKKIKDSQITNLTSVNNISINYDWKVSGKITKDKNLITYLGNHMFQTDFGFINYYMGYQQQKLVWDLNEGTSTLTKETIRPLIALTNKLIRNAEIEFRESEIGIISENLHSNYWKAHLKNLSSLMIFSTVSLQFNFDNVFKDIKLLDLVMFDEYEIGTQKQVLNEQISGLYFVTKIVRTLTNGNYLTSVKLNREAINQPKGNLK